MSDMQTFSETVDEFMEHYKVIDKEGVYMSKGVELVPIFRMKQWFEHSERKKGKWMPHIEKSREYIGTVLVNVWYDYWFCDTCGYRVENGQPLYNFCPNCGADMRGEKDETD